MKDYSNATSWQDKNILIGSVAQLDRVPDYGSGGSRFEPWRSHFFLALQMPESQSSNSPQTESESSINRTDQIKLNIMSRICDLTGKRPISGHNVSHSNVKTKRRFLPNLHKKRFYVPETDQWVTLKVSSNALRTINKLGVYAYVKKLEKKGIDTGIKLNK